MLSAQYYASSMRAACLWLSYEQLSGWSTSSLQGVSWVFDPTVLVEQNIIRAVMLYTWQPHVYMIH